MTTFTISIPAELKTRLDSKPEINWSEYIKQRFEVRLSEFEKIKKKRT